MEILLLLVLFASVTVMIFAFGWAGAQPASAGQQRLREVLAHAMPAPEEQEISDRLEQTLKPFSEALPKSPEELGKTQRMLVNAGYREQRHSTIYYGSRVLLAAVGATLGFLLMIGPGSFLLMVSLALIGYVLPRFVVKRMISRRQKTIRLSLPDALDLMIVCVEAGLSLDHHAHPALTDELRLVNLEVRAGKPRAEALRNLSNRTGVDDMRALVAVLVQTDRFGTSVSQALRVHSDALRTERRQRAEEAAAKTTIKMVPVLVFFIFPPMLIATVGPAVIQFIRVVMPELNE
jgi:tight adherence protein C